MARLKDIAKISTTIDEPDFWICIKGSEKNLGEVRKTKPEKSTSWAGIKVKEEYLDRILPNYLFYVMMYFYNSGIFRQLSMGTLDLQHLRIEDIGSKIQLDIPESIESKASRRFVLNQLFKFASK